MSSISIVTVVYNNRHLIAHAIESVLNQNISNLEYIIIDGNSTDGTLEIIKKYKSRISQIISEPDSGLYDAMNKGLALASGDIVGILNSDDFYTSNNTLNDVIKSFEKNNCDILYGDVNYVQREHSDKLVRSWVSGVFDSNYFEKGYVPAHPSVFIKNRLAKKYTYNLNYRLAADYDWLLRLFKDDELKISYLAKPIINMRLGGATSKNWKNILKGNLEIARSWLDNEKKIPLLTLFYYRPKVKFKQFV